MSNLPFIAKSTGREVIGQIFDHCTAFVPLPDNQSSYRQGHSTESTLVEVHSDILMDMDKQVVAILVLLDLRVAFDTIDHKILLETFETDFGVVSNAKKWISSILSCRTQRVLMNQNSSKSFDINCGVLQGSCLGAILFIMYASGIFNVVKKHLPSSHAYGDNT